MTGDGAAPSNNLKPGDIPAAVVDRDNERTAAAATLIHGGAHHLYLYGPRGTGKTLCAQDLLREVSDEMNTCYISGVTDDTQYRVLAQLYTELTGETISDGYHTARLYNQLNTCLQDRETVIVLDDIAFLLLNDGDDLLYYLTRMAPDTVRIVAISANYPDLGPRVDDRTDSSFRPRRLSFAPYTADQATRILTARAQNAIRQPVTDPALEAVTATTTNIRLGLHWLAQATTATDDVITADRVHAVRTEAVQRYRDALLADFSAHHHLLLEAVEQLTAGTERITSGAVYDRYESLCDATGDDTLTHRRVSDFLTHLELLGIIQVEYHRGGIHGKTREIHLTSPLEQG